MKNRNNKIIGIILSITLVLALITTILYFGELQMYSYITLTLLMIGIIVLLMYLNNTKSENTVFKSKIKNIINTYDSILAKVDILPDLTDKDIVFIPKFEELINTQGETKKPIFYNVTEKTASFVLIDNNLVCYSIIKENDSLIDPIESKLMIANAKKNVKDIDESILADLEQTTIIKLPNIGSYKVSPIRKKDTQKEEPVKVEETPVVEENNDKQEKKIKKNHATERARKYREKQRQFKKVGIE